MYYVSQGTFAKDKRFISKWTNFSTKKVVSTFGTVKRFAPEPGSVLSKS
jgi:hypothetical protein